MVTKEEQPELWNKLHQIYLENGKSSHVVLSNSIYYVIVKEDTVEFMEIDPNNFYGSVSL